MVASVLQDTMTHNDCVQEERFPCFLLTAELNTFFLLVLSTVTWPGPGGSGLVPVGSGPVPSKTSVVSRPCQTLQGLGDMFL